MSEVTSATVERPKMQTVSSLGDFLAKRKDVQAEAAKTDAHQGEQAGQSEPGKPADGNADPAATKTDKKEKTADELKAELSNQAKANLRLGKERAELQRQLEESKRSLEELKAKADGTYVEPSKEQQDREALLRAEFAKFEERKTKSADAAVKEFGEEFVLTNIYADESPYATLQKEQPWLVQRVMAAAQPVHEAIAVLNEHTVLTKFGRTEAAVLAAAEAILRPKLFAEFTKDLEQSEGSGAKPVSRVPSLAHAKNAGHDARAGAGDSVRTFSALGLNPHNRV